MPTISLCAFNLFILQRCLPPFHSITKDGWNATTLLMNWWRVSTRPWSRSSEVVWSTWSCGNWTTTMVCDCQRYAGVLCGFLCGVFMMEFLYRGFYVGVLCGVFRWYFYVWVYYTAFTTFEDLTNKLYIWFNLYINYI